MDKRWTNKWKEKVFTKERGKKISETLKRKYAERKIIPYFKGKNLSEKHKHKIKEGVLKGENSPAWKGNKVGYIALHQWIKKYKVKPERCPICKKNKKLELSNKSGDYKRKLNDWEWICRSCHMKKDMNKSKQWRNKISKSLSGRKIPIDVRKKISNSNKGRLCSEKTKRRISKANKIALKKYWKKRKEVTD